jgi:hypothetical protein
MHLEQFAETIYLAIALLCGVQTEQAKYYGQESGHTRSRVDLRKKTGKATKRESHCSSITDHYRPAIGSTPCNDTPLIVKGSDELPARGGGPGYNC